MSIVTVIASASEAIHGAANWKDGLLRRFAPRNDAETWLRDLAAGYARGLLENFLTLLIRGRREHRVRAAPAVSCAKRAQKHAHEHTGSAEAIRHSLRNGLRLIARSPW